MNWSDILLLNKSRKLSYSVVGCHQHITLPPYAVGFVGDCRKVSEFLHPDIADQPFKIGMEMEVHEDILWKEGEKEYVGYRFRPL